VHAGFRRPESKTGARRAGMESQLRSGGLASTGPTARRGGSAARGNTPPGPQTLAPKLSTQSDDMAAVSAKIQICYARKRERRNLHPPARSGLRADHINGKKAITRSAAFEVSFRHAFARGRKAIRRSCSTVARRLGTAE
jgi:hypothetical protein